MRQMTGIRAWFLTWVRRRVDFTITQPRPGHDTDAVVFGSARLLKLGRWGAVNVHEFVNADHPGCYHTHPCRAFRLVLLGGYVEEVKGGRRRRWRPGMCGFVKPQFCHRVDQLTRPCVTLWIEGPRTHRIMLVGGGWYALGLRPGLSPIERERGAS